MDTLYIATAFAIFVSVALLIEGLYLWWNARHGAQAKRVARRLQEMAPAASELQKSMLLTQNQQAMPALLRNSRLVGSLSRLLAHSGSQISVIRFCLTSAGIGGATLAALLLTGVHVAIAAGIAIFACALPLLLALRRRARRQEQLEQQLPEALELMSRALRAGHALPTAVKMAADEIPEPLGGEFRILFNEVNYGVPMHDALKNLATRIPGSDVGFFVVSVLIQRETGGNLAELLDTISRIVRERLKLLSQVKVYSAEGKLSAWILSLLPFGLGGVLFLVNPKFMAVLWSDPSGLKMMGVVAALMAVGILWMRSVIRIRV
jgi:tight adherence protein B